MTGCSYPSISLSSCLFVSFTHTKHAWVGTFCTIIGDGGRSKGEGGLILSLPSAGIRHVSAPPFPPPPRKIYIFQSSTNISFPKTCQLYKKYVIPTIILAFKSKEMYVYFPAFK